MGAVTKAHERSNAVARESFRIASQAKAAGFLDLTSSVNTGSGFPFQNQAATRQRYSLNRGWVYSAIHVIAQEAAAQPVTVAELTGRSSIRDPKSRPVSQKQLALLRRVPKQLQTRAARQELRILLDHPLNEQLESPNPAQTRDNFVYMFVANLLLTGWGFVVGGETDEGEYEFYALPTTWVVPDHKEGLFSRFHIVDPKNPTRVLSTLSRENVAFAHIPNPADPLSALAPAQSQISAIRIDDHILTSQEKFFENGVFPSVIVTVGKDPHPEVAAGVRPRLTGAQRRQVIGAIKKVMSGVANYGSPAIVDGLIEKIERLSATQNEMGWDKSEGAVRRRILSAFGVHPYILGEAVNVGGYAQVANIEKRFCKRVNACLDMLSVAMSNFVAPLLQESNKILVWWEPCAPVDEQLRWKNLNDARKRGDITRNEVRTELGFVPDETNGDRTRQWSAGDVQSLSFLLANIVTQSVTREQAAAIIQEAFDVPEEVAEKMAGVGLPIPELPEPADNTTNGEDDEETDTEEEEEDGGAQQDT